MLDGNPPHPRHANLLYMMYIAMDLRHPSYIVRHRRRKAGTAVPKWNGFPLAEDRKRLMAVLLVHGSSKECAMETVSAHLSLLAEAAGRSEQVYLGILARMLKAAEATIPEVQSQ
ncbi:hypothetical protein DFH06DRAFT_1316089 [Mycena polygramma]|nr:hypothetical protein DFH06DRAFT_1316089 [Mycena polygramma]